MKTSVDTNNIESKNGMSQVINILTGETKKIRCHYISSRTDKPVSRVLTLERLSHPALTAAGVTAWAERFNDSVNRFDWLRVSIQLTDKICYTPNCANHDLPSIEHYNDYNDVNRRNVDNFFQSIADKPAKMMTGEDWPNMAVIAAYRAAGRDKEAETLIAARDIYEARREAKNEAWSKKYAAQQYYYNSPKPKNFDELTELERAQFMMQTAQECAKDHPELDWTDILERAAKRLEKAKQEEEKAIREAEKAAKGDKKPTLEKTPEISDKAEIIGVLHHGTMVRMPGVVGGLKVVEIDREGDCVICKSDGEQHEYKSIAYFEQTAQEITIPRWLRIMKYFYIGPKDKEENRVLCTAIEPNNDTERPVIIHYNKDGEEEDSKIVLTSGLEDYNREPVAA